MFHQPYYPQQTKSFHNNQFYMPTQTTYYRSGPIPNQSSHHVNFNRTYEYFPMSKNGFPSTTTNNYVYNDFTNQQPWKSNVRQTQYQYRHTPIYHFQDKSTFYYMSEPIITSNNRITIQLTKVHIGKNGDQQRVYVEQEFSNQYEFKKFVKNLKTNFEKTFNNRANNVHTNDEHHKKPSVVVIEEPDEEPKVYEQKIYNENIKFKVKTNDVNYPLANLPKSIQYEQHTTHVASSSSTICLSRRQKSKIKSYPNNDTNKKNKKQNKKPSNYYYQQQQQQQQHYEIPSRFQQPVFNKENIFRMTNDYNLHWKFNQYQQPLHHQPYSYVLPMNDNFLRKAPSVFHDSFYQSSTLPPPPPSQYMKDQNRQPSRYRRNKKHRRNQPTTVTDNFTFRKTEYEQPRVHRTRSDCRQKPLFQTPMRTCQYLDYGIHQTQRTFVPLIPSRTPIYYPQRRFARNTQVNFRLFNIYRPNSIRF